ncbi:MAG TPA: proline racemase family protein [Methylomirabilota bacterium]|nr:proline racemase family protein [Methylomirabilota bacterium]
MSSVIHVVDSHTGGEPTRVIVAGGPDLGVGSIADQLIRFREKHDHVRAGVVNEPRGSDVLVGAILLPPATPGAAAGVIFFNNVGYLGMCGHGVIGVMATLAYLGKVSAGTHQIDTPVGPVEATLHADMSVSLRNVRSYRARKDVAVNVHGLGEVRGDVAWGGNWFFLVHADRWDVELRNVEQLTNVSWRIRQAVNEQGFPEVDHVELIGPGTPGKSDARNFVLCPGKAYDRSPCGTGTSAKLACLFADGKIKPGQTWRQESITGSIFEGEVEESEGGVAPIIRGRAYVNSEAKLIFNPEDPCCWGIR